MPVPIIAGVFGIGALITAATAWITKQIARIAIFFPVQLLITITAWAFYLTVFYFAVDIFTTLYNTMTTVSEKFTETTGQSGIIFKVASASGALGAVIDIFKLFFTIILMLFEYKLMLYVRTLGNKAQGYYTSLGYGLLGK
ncbi:hypothetical protein [Sulfurimonas sp.]|uniref:hypothetical protein n=1 Tax=Sulfurimonas sp. TaxID=2022749 RepID=UPI0019FAD2B3|nr:hypothetical protein [Sulfurimonas sp.]MBE0515160.1 hypothetical protein [Sulfurimonas sp.]